MDASVACEDTNARSRQIRFLPSDLLTLKVETLVNLVRDEGDTSDVVEIAKEAGFSITAEDIQSMQSLTVEFSDEELEGAAGGGHSGRVCYNFGYDGFKPRP